MYTVPSLSRHRRLVPALASALFGLWPGLGSTFDIFSEHMTAGVFVRKALIFSLFVALMIMIFRRGPGMRQAGEPLFTRRMQLMVLGAPILNVALQLAARPLLAPIQDHSAPYRYVTPATIGWLATVLVIAWLLYRSQPAFGPAGAPGEA